MKHRKCSAILLIRIIVGAIFIIHGLPKLINANEGMAGFVGGAFHSLGLTFLDPAQWLFVLGLGEVVLGVLLILGLFVSFVAPILAIIMLGAMNVKGWDWDKIELDAVLCGLAVALTVSGSGRFALQALFCKKCCEKNVDGKACCSKEKKAE